MLQWIAIGLSILILAATSECVSAPPTQGRTTSSAPTRELEFGPHGGELQLVDRVQCEVVFARNGVRVFLFDVKGKPVAARSIRGQVTFTLKGDARRHRHSLLPESTRDSESNCLYLPVNLSKVSVGTLSSRILLSGLPGRPAGSPSQLDAAYRLPLTTEQLAIHRQQICPVSGKDLGSMGKPVKVAVAPRQNVYVCCAGCSSPLKARPDAYLARLKTRAPAAPNQRAHNRTGAID